MGIRLAPFGRVPGEEARQVFAEQIEALCSCNVDLIIIETISDLYEIREAIQAARQVCSLPVIASIGDVASGSGFVKNALVPVLKSGR